MAFFSSIIGGSAFGLAARVGQLAIQKRNITDNLGGHFIAMGVFGFAGYWAEVWDQRAAELLTEKRAQIAARREAAASA